MSDTNSLIGMASSRARSSMTALIFVAWAAGQLSVTAAVSLGMTGTVSRFSSLSQRVILAE